MNEVMQLGRYTLHAQLAGGGMATVYLARLNGAVGFGRTVAIKRLHPHLAKDPEFVTMFLDEARLSARIQHQNVVPTLDVVATDGELFLVLEYVKGETLSVLNRGMARKKALIPMPVVTSLVVGMLNGLDAAHEARDERGVPLEIVHRDVSPQNVMVGSDGVARILDFGIAKAASRLGNTREGQLKGKIAYMAPEQLMGQVSRQTDIYAAGVVLWEELTGRRLFYADSEVHTMSLVQRGDIPRPSAIASRVPGALDDIVMKALARRPEDRYATAHEMAAAIESVSESASPNRVAEWLRDVAGDLIDARAKLVKEIESGVSRPGPVQVFDQLRSPGVQDSGPYSSSALRPVSSPSHPLLGQNSSQSGFPGTTGPFDAIGTGAGRVLGAPFAPDPNMVPTQSASTVSLMPSAGALGSHGSQGARNRALVIGAALLGLLIGLTAVGVFLVQRGRGEPIATTGATKNASAPPPESNSSSVTSGAVNGQSGGVGTGTLATPTATPSGGVATTASSGAPALPATPIAQPSATPVGTVAVAPPKVDPKNDPRNVPPKNVPPKPPPKNGNDLDTLLDSR